jgi:hypothetical protein
MGSPEAVLVRTTHRSTGSFQSIVTGIRVATITLAGYCPSVNFPRITHVTFDLDGIVPDVAALRSMLLRENPLQC